MAQDQSSESNDVDTPGTSSQQSVSNNTQVSNTEAGSRAVAMPNLPFPTLGGKQFWTDRRWRAGWRIQQNAVSGHFRLISPANLRFAWGNLSACEKSLNEHVPSSEFKASTAVILLHGLSRSTSSMVGLGKAIDREADCQVVYFEYASTRASIAHHAAALREVVSSLPKGKQICFVGHSMGNIVVRHAIADWQRTKDQQTLDRLGSVVMLGPPNQGASIARELGKLGLFKVITGDGGMELGPGWAGLEQHLAVPPCPFGIVAGRLPSYISNPLVGEEGDFVVGVEEARLEGAADFLEVPRMHSFLMDDPEVQRATIHFLHSHRFHSKQKEAEAETETGRVSNVD